MKHKKIKFKVGDNVYILTGSYKGKQGKIKKILQKRNSLIVENINIKIKHYKAKNSNEKGQIMQIEAPINHSNVKNIE